MHIEEAVITATEVQVRKQPAAAAAAAALACRARAFHNVMALLFFVVIYKNALCLEPHVHG